MLCAQLTSCPGRLQEAAAHLQQAQAAEDSLLAAAQARALPSSKTRRCGAPHILMRTLSSITVTSPPVQAKGRQKPAFFAAFAKPFGSGVGLSINSTAMELEGTGVQQPLGSRVDITGQLLHVPLVPGVSRYHNFAAGGGLSRAIHARAVLQSS